MIGASITPGSQSCCLDAFVLPGLFLVLFEPYLAAETGHCEGKGLTNGDYTSQGIVAYSSDTPILVTIMQEVNGLALRVPAVPEVFSSTGESPVLWTILLNNSVC